MVRLLKKRFKGVAALEAAMTLPIILNMLFFSLEFIRVELAQIAADAIARRCTMELMDSSDPDPEDSSSKLKKMDKFDDIISEFRPMGIPLENIRYYIRLYPDLHNPDPQYPTDPSKYDKDNPGAMDVSPYGGETIGWAGSDYDNPSTSPNAAAKSNNYGLSSSHPLMRGYYNTAICNGPEFGEIGDANRKNCLTSKDVNIKGWAFVFTVAIKFPFSSSFVAQFFGNGSNTNKPGVYIVWARGSGIINND